MYFKCIPCFTKRTVIINLFLQVVVEGGVEVVADVVDEDVVGVVVALVAKMNETHILLNIEGR